MVIIEESVTIGRPVAAVFAYIADATNVPVYDASVVLMTQVTDGPTGLGTRWRGATKILGRDFGWVSECTEFILDRSMTITSVQGKVAFEIRMSVAPDGTLTGTRLHYRLTAATGLGGVCGKLTDPLVVRSQTRTVRANLGTLKELLETAGV
jgi:uncharacterized membrane protein